MTALLPENPYCRKLAHAYVALALAQDVAKCYVSEQQDPTALNPLLTILAVTAELLEEILQDALPEESPLCSLPLPCSEVLM